MKCITLRLRAPNTHGEVLEWPGLLDVGERLLEVAQLLINLAGSLLCIRNLRHRTPYSETPRA